jgi:hypothetical protein
MLRRCLLGQMFRRTINGKIRLLARLGDALLAAKG